MTRKKIIIIGIFLIVFFLFFLFLQKESIVEHEPVIHKEDFPKEDELIAKELDFVYTDFEEKEHENKAQGFVYCHESNPTSIMLKYEFSKGENVSLFREDYKITTWSKSYGYGFIVDENLSPNTSYLYYIRNGTSPDSDIITRVPCKTKPIK